MCGLAGLFDPGRVLAPARLAPLARAMADTLVHRGPDDGAVWAEPDEGVAFGFRRLAIVDLSLEGRQPMHSHCGRFAVAMNGEIYNYRALRAELDAECAPRWRGHSDTEVLLEWIARKGLDAALTAANGMFALALWDRARRELVLARDRLGKKPMYYGRIGGVFAFASELKALRILPGFDGTLDKEGVGLFLRHGYVPSPLSIFRAFRKIVPGEVVRVPADGGEVRRSLFWDARAVAERACAEPFAGSDDEMAERLSALIDDSAALRMVADVPVGAFLSGGIDSSTVAAAMVAGSGRVRTFSIGFRGTRYDESAHAGAVARHLGTEHTEMQVDERACLDVVRELPKVYDEPFADASQVPTLVLSKLTRQHVTVALSGDGGDELFGGYPRYRRAAAEWAGIWPAGLRPLARGAASAIAPFDGKAGRAFARRGATVPEEIYADHVSLWHEGDRIGASSDPLALFALRGVPALASPARRFMALDALTYLPDDLLAKVDRASMAHGLEVRCPLLDYRIVEFAWSLPDRASFSNGGAKHLLRRVLHRRVPLELVERPKMGFEPPVGDWLRGPLREWAEGLLNEANLARAGWVAPRAVGARWRRHLAGRNATYPLWTVLMLHSWLESGGDKARALPAGLA